MPRSHYLLHMPMKICIQHRIILLFCLLFCTPRSSLAKPFESPAGIDSLQKALHQVLENKQAFDRKKLQEIRKLKGELEHHFSSLNDRYENYQKLFNAYKSFIQDSAYLYCKKLNACAFQLKDSGKIHYARVNMGFVLISSGYLRKA